MNKEELNKEQSVLRQMRKTLGSIVKDATPLGGRPHPLTNSTIEEIKDCFALISEREKELADKLGFNQATPYYADGEQPSSSALSFVKLPKYKI
jgi:hypothetical protein